MHNKIEPLYKLAKKGKLGDVQIMDLKTINWIKKNCNYDVKRALMFVKKSPKIKIDEFLKILPNKKQFNKKTYISIHGIMHTTRVIIYIFLLCKLFRVGHISTSPR